MKKSRSGFQWRETYLSLNPILYSVIDKKQESHNSIELINSALASELDIDETYLRSEDGISLLSGQKTDDKRLFAQAYSGHQFGYLNTLGDGRALMLGEHEMADGRLFDIQLKGSGRTPYSRGGDGKATLYSMLREYLISEAIHALHIPTSRALAILNTNETIRRIKDHKGAILTRVASSHIRVGTFVFASINGGKELVKELADYTIKRHYKDLLTHENPYQAFIHKVIEQQARLIALWQSVGFIHGVLNTDNVLVSGETIDYGPCAFMNEYDPNCVFSSIDREGRYSYENQSYITSWNLARFIETMLALLADNKEEAVTIANEELASFGPIYQKEWLKVMSLKVGFRKEFTDDKKRIEELLSLMRQYKDDFTNTFRFLSSGDYNHIHFYSSLEGKNWIQDWEKRIKDEGQTLAKAREEMKKHNPYIIPRNSIVEKALLKASEEDDYSLFDELLELLKDPFNHQREIRKELLEGLLDNKSFTSYCGT